VSASVEIVHSKVSSEDAKEAFKALGTRVDTAKLEAAAKVRQWYQEIGASGIAIADILKDLEFWKKIEDRYDPLASGEYSEEKLTPKETLEYMRFRMELSNHKLAAHKELHKLSSPNSIGTTKKGVKASVRPGSNIPPVTIINPLAGRA
jgi:hypothetical protein